MNSPEPNSSTEGRAQMSASVYGCERRAANDPHTTQGRRKSDTTPPGTSIGKRLLRIVVFATILGAVAFVGGVPTLVGFVLGAAMTVRHTLSRT
jgi:hypothetical protein